MRIVFSIFKEYFGVDVKYVCINRNSVRDSVNLKFVFMIGKCVDGKRNFFVYRKKKKKMNFRVCMKINEIFLFNVDFNKLIFCFFNYMLIFK